VGVLGGGNGITQNGSQSYLNADGQIVLTDDPTSIPFTGDVADTGYELVDNVGSAAGTQHAPGSPTGDDV
jgi:hypothetical protein